MTLYPEASFDRIEAVHEEQPHLEASLGGGGVATGLRVGLGFDADEPSLPKKVPVHTLQFSWFKLHHASGQFTPLSHEQPVHVELLAVVVTSLLVEVVTSVVSGIVDVVLVVVVLVLLVVVSGSTGGGVGYT